MNPTKITGHRNPGKMPVTTENFHEGTSSSFPGETSLVRDQFQPTGEDGNHSDTPSHDHELPVEDNEENGAKNNDDVSDSEKNEQPSNHRNPRKRKYYCRHTPQQINELENFFKGCPHPTERQRRDLAYELGLDALQVKFWFQNKRTQAKTEQEPKENIELHVANEKLRRENMEMKKDITVTVCESCGDVNIVPGPSAEQLEAENAKLRREIQLMTAAINIVRKAGKPSLLLTPYYPSSFRNQGRLRIGENNILSGDMIRGNQSLRRPSDTASKLEKSSIPELVNLALEEIDVLARVGDPMWKFDHEQNAFVLNEQVYFNTFQRGSIPRLAGFRSEASQEIGIVNMSPLNIVGIFMSLNKWLAVFSGMISRATLLEVLSPGVEGTYNGAQQLIEAKFQVLSPAIPTRECVFVRYCKQLNEVTWAVVDVSMNVDPDGITPTCLRRPSGCIIQGMPNGYSKITWIEHVRVKDHDVHGLSWSIMKSGVAYGAKRWISVLRRQCERLTSARRVRNNPQHESPNGLVPSYQTKHDLFKLAERMVLNFYGVITSSPGAYHWTTMSGNGVDEVRIMTKKNTEDLGRPRGLVLSASMCLWIPTPPKLVFDYILNDGTRSQWDILSVGGNVQRMASIRNGREAGNCVTILRVTKTQTNESNLLILQESSNEPTASYVIYSPVNVTPANMLFRGRNSERVQILPSGFTILPSEGYYKNKKIDGTLLTIAFQFLADSDPAAKLSVACIATAKNLIDTTILKIKENFGLEGSPNEIMEKS